MVAAAVLLALSLMPTSAASQAPEPSLEAVVARATEYVTDLQRQLSGIVGEETYVQDSRAFVSTSMRDRSETLRRQLKSDFLLVRPTEGDNYIEFRDVFEVDGRPVRDRQERLTRLFLDPSASAAGQIERIVFESARYNIGNIHRTVNTPTLPLLFLDPKYQPRFTFTRATDTRPTLVRAKETSEDPTSPWYLGGTDVWVIEYVELAPNTMVRTTDDKDLPARGRFWIEPATGRVLASEVHFRDSAVRATVDVSYQSEPVVGFHVPKEMRERYEGLGDGSRVEGTASYSRFRRFQVRAEETVDPVQD